jgi:MYXO-CTERM domain-containing protein
MSLRFGVVAALAVLLFGAPVCQAAIISDLPADFSNVNGAPSFWSYKAGTNPMYYYDDWYAFPAGTADGWVAGNNVLYDFVPAVVKFNTDYLAWNAGEVGIHAWDGGNGDGHGEANVVWTSNFTGSVSVSGQLENTSLDRKAVWSLYSGGTLGFLETQTFASGLQSGQSLDNIAVTPGSTFTLWFIKDSSATYAPMAKLNFQVQDTVPEPATWLLGLAGFALLAVRRKRL